MSKFTQVINNPVALLLIINADGGLRVGCERERQCGETEKSM